MKKYLITPHVVFPAVVVFYSFIFLSWWQYELEFSFMWNNISRLGRPSMNPDGYVLWFIGVVVSAILMSGYYLSLPIWKIGEQKIDRAVQALVRLGFLASLLLILLSVFNSDYKLAHKIIGGAYFSTDLLMMGIAAWLFFRHPQIDKGLAFLCILSAGLDITYLVSNAKWSWAEWATVAVSFAIAAWLALISKRVLPEDQFETSSRSGIPT